MPPSPVVKFLIGWSEKIDVPRAPTFSPAYAAPATCAASSRSGTPRRLARARSGARSSGAPAKCTGTISLVFAVSAASTRSAVVISVSVSTSTHTGVAPDNEIKFGVDAQVIDGVTTSSPGPIPSARRTRCRPAVADVIATAWRAPVYAANARSSSAHCAPVVIQPDWSTAVTAATSAGVIEGRENGRNGCEAALLGSFRDEAKVHSWL